jgi:sugar lactone lactonase YvrE
MPEGNKAYTSADSQASSSRVAANSVAAFSDGTIIATIPQRPGSTNLQRLRGEPTGDVVDWKPGTDSFRVVPGTQLAGNNGIEITLDEREFYVVSFGSGHKMRDRKLAVAGDTAQPVMLKTSSCSGYAVARREGSRRRAGPRAGRDGAALSQRARR